MSLDTFDSFINNSEFQFENSVVNTEKAEVFETNSIKAILTTSQISSPGTLKGIIKIQIANRLLAGKFKMKLVTNFEMKKLKNKASSELEGLLEKIKLQENRVDGEVDEEEQARKEKSGKLWAQVKRKSKRYNEAVKIRVSKLKISPSEPKNHNSLKEKAKVAKEGGWDFNEPAKSSTELKKEGKDGHGQSKKILPEQTNRSSKVAKNASNHFQGLVAPERRPLSQKKKRRSAQFTKMGPPSVRAPRKHSQFMRSEKILKIKRDDRFKDLLGLPEDAQVQSKSTFSRMADAHKVYSKNNQLFEHFVSMISTKEITLFTMNEDVSFSTVLCLPFELKIPADYPFTVIQDLAPTSKVSLLQVISNHGWNQVTPISFQEFVQLRHQLMITYEANNKGQNEEVFALDNMTKNGTETTEKFYSFIDLEIFKGNYEKKSTIKLTNLKQVDGVMVLYKEPKPCYRLCLPHKPEPRWVKARIEVTLNKQVFYGREEQITLSLDIPDLLHQDFNEVEVVLVSKKIIKNKQEEELGDENQSQATKEDSEMKRQISVFIYRKLTQHKSLVHQETKDKGDKRSLSLNKVFKQSLLSKLKEIASLKKTFLALIQERKSSLVTLLKMLCQEEKEVFKGRKSKKGFKSVIEKQLNGDQSEANKDYIRVDKIIYRDQVKLHPLKRFIKTGSRVYKHCIDLKKMKSQLQNMDNELMLIKYLLVVYLNKEGRKFERFVCEYEIEFRAMPTSINSIQKGKLSVVEQSKKMNGVNIDDLVEKQVKVYGDQVFLLPYTKISL